LGRKRTRFTSYPRPAIAVRGLWEQASAQEKDKAHHTCMAILEYWLGKATKQEVARRLEVPPLRVWQLSQQALSGMLAGLLRQPKSRRKLPPMPASPEQDPVVLRKRIVALERKLGRTEDLVRVLKDLPWAKDAALGPKKERDARTRRRTGPKRRRGAQVSPVDTTQSRTNAEVGDERDRAAGAGGDAGRDAEDAAQLET
jgi:hypothetical protein